MNEQLNDSTPTSTNANGSGKRALVNILVQPREQLMVVLVFVAFAAVSLAGFSLIFIFTMISAIQRVSAESDISTPALRSLEDALRLATITTAGFGVTLVIMMIAVGFALSHRLFGPTVQLKRLTHRLAQGDYSARGTLRKGDAYHDVMASLNGLAKDLEAKHGPSAQPSQNM